MENQKKKKLSHIKNKYLCYLLGGLTYGAFITTFLFAFIYNLYQPFEMGLLWVCNLFSMFGLVDIFTSIFKGDKRNERKKNKQK